MSNDICDPLQEIHRKTIAEHLARLRTLVDMIGEGLPHLRAYQTAEAAAMIRVAAGILFTLANEGNFLLNIDDVSGRLWPKKEVVA